jgi:hypothetical protein
VSDQNPKQKLMVAKGVAPVPPELLLSAWTYLLEDPEPAISGAAKQSLKTFPETSLLSLLQKDLDSWVLNGVGVCRDEEIIREALFLHPRTPIEFLLGAASTCSERLANLLAENQERIIEYPALVVALEKNPKSLKSSIDRLRQFLKLAGIYIPGDPLPEKPKLVVPPPSQTQSESPEASVSPEEAEEELPEADRVSLQRLIMGLNVGAKTKLALKGNKEARGILIKDTNKVVATSVLKSPRITENEVVHFSGMKNLSEDVVRDIAKHPGWTKNYGIKLNLIQHPKAPPAATIQYLKFLSLRDLGQVSKSRTVPGPIRKAAKQLLVTKRK